MFRLTLVRAILLLVGIGILVYSKTFFNQFVLDDPSLIIELGFVKNFKIAEIFSSSASYSQHANIFSVYFKPLMFAVFSFIYQIFHTNPIGYHLVQIFLHIVNSLLLYLVFKKFFKEYLAFILSLIFLVHPVNFEAAGYISSLQDTLFLFFGLGAMFVLISDAAKKEFSFLSYFFVGFGLLLSIFAKETGILFAISGFLYVLIFKPNRLMFYLSTLVAFYSFYFLFRLASLQNVYGYLTPSTIMEDKFASRMLSVPSVIFHYISIFVFPLNLTSDSHWIIKKATVKDFYLPIFYLVSIYSAISFFLLKLLREHNKLANAFVYFLFWAILGLTAHSQAFFSLDKTVADRWFYFTIIGFLGLLGVFASYFVKLKFFGYSRIEFAVYVMIIFLLLSLCLRTFIRSLDWQNPETLYLHDLKISPESYSLENLYGAILLQRKEFLASEPYFKNAILKNPNHVPAYINLGYCYEKLNDYDNSRFNYQKAINLPTSGTDYKPFLALARVELTLGNNPAQAKAVAERGLEKYPSYLQLKTYLAISEYSLGNKKEALVMIEEIYKKDKSENVRKIKNAIENNVPIK